jgi:hypothetical protein
MALNLPPPGGGADRHDILKYDARAGRLFRVDRTQSATGWSNETIEITRQFQAVMDLENIEHGWLSFPTNDAPDLQTVRLSEPMPARPSRQHRAGFRVFMVLGRTAGGGVKEMAANAQASIQGMDRLHNLYLEGVKSNPGMLPVVELADTESIVSSGKGGDGRPVSSTNYIPIWRILKWVPRPPELPASGRPAPVGSAPAATQADVDANFPTGPAQQQAPQQQPLQQQVRQPEPVLDDF